MTSSAPAYHRQVAREKRASILAAAMALFTEMGYRSTSLARVAEVADVSKATLFKQFPTKDALFTAIVLERWGAGSEVLDVPVSGDPRAGLTMLGTRYAELVGGDRMAGLFRMVIAEAPRFPELARIQFDLGKAPFFDTVRSYIHSAGEAGVLEVADSEMAATQFLGMISNYVLWPKMLLTDWTVSSSDVARVVDEAVITVLARHQPSSTHDKPHLA